MPNFSGAASRKLNTRMNPNLQISAPKPSTDWQPGNVDQVEPITISNGVVNSGMQGAQQQLPQMGQPYENGNLNNNTAAIVAMLLQAAQQQNESILPGNPGPNGDDYLQTSQQPIQRSMTGQVDMTSQMPQRSISGQVNMNGMPPKIMGGMPPKIMGGMPTNRVNPMSPPQPPPIMNRPTPTLASMQGRQDSRGLQGILARGNSVYNGGNPNAQSGTMSPYRGAATRRVKFPKSPSSPQTSLNTLGK